MNKYLKFSLIFALAFIAFFYFYIELYNQYLQSPTNSLEASNTTIQFILLITGIITIVFLYINYDQQKKQIRKQQQESEYNKEDSEFNRALSIIYQQLEYANKRLTTIKYKLPFQENTIMGYINKDLDAIIEKKTYDKTSTDLVLRELTKEIDFFVEVINNHSLSTSKKIELNKIVYWNIGTEHGEYISGLSELFDHYKPSVDADPTRDIYSEWYTRYHQIKKLHSYLTGGYYLLNKDTVIKSDEQI